MKSGSTRARPRGLRLGALSIVLLCAALVTGVFGPLVDSAAAASSGTLSFAEIEGFWVAAGGPASQAATAAAITGAEASFHPGAIQQGTAYCGSGSNKTGWGLWQITCGNSVPQFCVDHEQLDPWNNAEAAVAKYKAAGNSFQPWTTYNTGAYHSYMPSNPPAPAQVGDPGQFVPVGSAPAGTHNASSPGATCGPAIPGPTPPPPSSTTPVRDIALLTDQSGYTLSGDGALHPFGAAPAATGGPSWPGSDVARRVALLPSGTGGYVLDRSGGLQPFAVGTNTPPPAATGAAYWPNQDVARGLTLLPDGSGGYVLDDFGGLHAFAVGSNPMPPAPVGGPYWSGQDMARAVHLTPAGNGGYVLDAWGGLHPFALSGYPAPPAIPSGNGPYWSGQDVARDFAVAFNGQSGYVLDDLGGIHPFWASGPQPVAPTSGAYFGSDVARGIVLDHKWGTSGYVVTTDGAVNAWSSAHRVVKAVMIPGSTTAGYRLEADGTLVSFGGAAPASGGPYWPGQDTARGVVMLPTGTGGYVLDDWGGLHPFAVGSNSVPAATQGGPYWPGQDTARGVVMLPTGTGGYVLDDWGGLHPFAVGSNPVPPAPQGGPYWPGQDVARGVVLLPTGTGGYVLDDWGGLHPFAVGTSVVPPATQGGPYWVGQDVARDVTLTNTGTSGYVLDDWGGLHPFAVGTGVVPRAPSGGAYFAGWDVAVTATMAGPSGGVEVDTYGGVYSFAT